MSTDTELAWAAGFFDGEGCFSVHSQKGRPGRVQCSVTQAHPEVLERFCRAVGVGRVSGPRTRKDSPSHHKPQWRILIRGPKVHQVADALWPYLGSVKKNQYLAKKELTS